MTKTIKNVSGLIAAGLVPEIDHTALDAVAKKYAIAISPHLQTIINRDGVKQQFVPNVAELNNTQQDLTDPIGDSAHMVVPGLIHRYPDRCLLQPVTVCPVYCRFCFRREVVGQGRPSLNSQQLQDCYNYIQQHPEIWEVILSGGDPLILKPKQLQQIIANLDKIKHVEIIRIHTRVPMLDPKRVDDALLSVLTQRQPIYVILHINHPEEFTAAAIDAINKLVNSGIVLLGQTVLLKGINDNVATLGQLMRNMVKHRIKPYYLHHSDLAVGTNHFRTTIAHGQELMASLRGNYSGLCQPQYVLDIPGGAGKSPIGPNYLCKDDHSYKVTNYMGIEYLYHDQI
jgi:lysine 2,3-aminomutase